MKLPTYNPKKMLPTFDPDKLLKRMQAFNGFSQGMWGSFAPKLKPPQFRGK